MCFCFKKKIINIKNRQNVSTFFLFISHYNKYHLTIEFIELIKKYNIKKYNWKWGTKYHQNLDTFLSLIIIIIQYLWYHVR